MARQSAAERFRAKVRLGPVPEHRPDLGPCYLWIAGLGNAGYGTFWFEGKTHRAYKFSYERCVGSIPKGFELDHLCRVRECVRPSHLEPVTHLVNLKRARVDRLQFPKFIHYRTSVSEEELILLEK